MREYKDTCPFCGRKPKTTVKRHALGIWKAIATCRHCAVSMYVFGKTRDEARKRLTEKWNTRYERTCHFDSVFHMTGSAITWKCSECGEEHDGYIGFTPVNYCPMCGAKKVSE